MIKKIVFLVIGLIFSAAFVSCKKCITCIVKDNATGDIKYQERSCAKGPLFDDWQESIKATYPPPEYNTVCK